MIPKKRKSTRGDDPLGTSSTSWLLHNSIPSCQSRIAHGPLIQADSMTGLSSSVQTNSPSDSEEDEENVLPSDEEIVSVIQPYVPPLVDDLMSTMTIVPVVRRKSQDMAIVPGIQLHFWGFPENKAQRYGIEDMDRDVYSVVPVANMDWNQEDSEFVSAMFQPFSTQGEATSPLSQPFEQRMNVSQQFELTEGVFDETNRDQGGIMILDDEQVSDLADKMMASVRDFMESEGSEIQEIFKKKGSMDESEMEGPVESENTEGKEDVYDAIFAGQSGMDPEQQFIKEANAFIQEQAEPKKPIKCECKKLGKDKRPLNKPCLCKRGKRSSSILPDDLSVPVIEEKPLGEEEPQEIAEAIVPEEPSKSDIAEEAPQESPETDEVESSVTGEETSEREVPEEEEGIELDEPTENEEETTEQQQDTGEAEEEPPVVEEETTTGEELPDTGEEEVEADEPSDAGEEAAELEEPVDTGEDTTEPEELPEIGDDEVEPEEPEENGEEISVAGEQEESPEKKEEEGVESEEGEEGVGPDELAESSEAEVSDNGEEEVIPEEPLEVDEEELPETGEEAVEPEEPSETEEEVVEDSENVIVPGELSDTGEEEVEQEESPEEKEEEGVESEEGEEGVGPDELTQSSKAEVSDNGEEEVIPEEPLEVDEEELPETGEEAVEPEEPSETEEEPMGQEEEGEELVPEEAVEAAEDDIESEELPDTGEEVEEAVEPELPETAEIVEVSNTRQLIEELSRCACCCMKLLLAQRTSVTTQMPSLEEQPCLAAAQIVQESNIVPGDETTVEEGLGESEDNVEPDDIPDSGEVGESEDNVEPDDIPDSGEVVESEDNVELDDIPDSGAEMVSDIETVPDVEEVPISEGISDVTDESDAGDAPVEFDVDEVPVIEAAEYSGELAKCIDEAPFSEATELDEATGEVSDEVPDDVTDEVLDSETPVSGEAEPDEVTDDVLRIQVLIINALPLSEESQQDEVESEESQQLEDDTREIIECVEDETVDDEIVPEISEPVITEEDVDIGDAAPDQEIDATEMPEGEEQVEVSKTEDEEAQQETSVAEETAAPTDAEEGSSAPEEVIESGEDEIPSEIEETPTEEDSKQGSEETENIMPGEASGSAVAHEKDSDEDEIIRKELSELVTNALSLEGGIDGGKQGEEEFPGAGDQLLTKILDPTEDQQITLTDEQIISREIYILLDKAISAVEGVSLDVLRPYDTKGTIIDINLVIKKRRHLQRKRIDKRFEFQEQKDVIEAPDGAIGDQPTAEETSQEEGEPAEPPKEDEGPTEAEVVPPETVEEIPCPEPPQEMPEESSNEKYRMKKFLAEFDIQMAPIKDRIRDLQKQVVDLGIPQFDRIVVLEPAFLRDPPAERAFEMPCKPCKKRPQPIKKSKRPFPPCCTPQTACPQADPSQFPPNCSCSRAPTPQQNRVPRNQPGTPRPTKCQCSSPKPGCGQN